MKELSSSLESFPKHKDQLPVDSLPMQSKSSRNTVSRKPLLWEMVDSKGSPFKFLCGEDRHGGTHL